MDLSKIKNLTNDQLVSLYRNPSTSNEIKKSLLKELKGREAEDLDTEILNEEDEFTQNQKLQLIFLPFLYRNHRKLMFKNGWSRKRDKQFWNYITLGIAIYSLIFLFALLFRTR